MKNETNPKVTSYSGAEALEELCRIKDMISACDREVWVETPAQQVPKRLYLKVIGITPVAGDPEFHQLVVVPEGVRYADANNLAEKVVVPVEFALFDHRDLVIERYDTTLGTTWDLKEQGDHGYFTIHLFVPSPELVLPFDPVAILG